MSREKFDPMNRKVSRVMEIEKSVVERKTETEMLALIETSVRVNE